MRRPRRTADPSATSLALFAAITLGGFVAIAAGWRVAARNVLVAFQVPALVSGGLGGLALIVIGAALASIQISRRFAATERPRPTCCSTSSPRWSPH